MMLLPSGQSSSTDALLDLPHLLVEGGDSRIAISAVTGRNRYHSWPMPDPAILPLGSCTASTISPTGFYAAERAWAKLADIARSRGISAAAREAGSDLEQRLLQLLGLDNSQVQIAICASGTDAMALAVANLTAARNQPLSAISVHGWETGRGVLAALAGDSGEVEEVCLRTDLGDLRPSEAVDADVARLAHAFAARGRHVLVCLTDVTKTGLIAPSRDCVAGLCDDLPGRIDVLVDACQARTSNAGFADYLARGWLVAITGSKFLAGPTFSGALISPGERTLPSSAGPTPPSLGVILRWEAALAEAARFQATPPDFVRKVLTKFRDRTVSRVTDDAAFEMLPGRPLHRSDAHAFDDIQTLFPFRIRATGLGARGPWLTAGQTSWVYQQLATASSDRRLELGQPVSCGQMAGEAASALRLCSSARLVGDAHDLGGANQLLGSIDLAFDRLVELARVAGDL